MSSRDHPDWWTPMGGQNSQDSILERRSLIWNDNNVVAPTAPPANYTGIECKGKFFTRGVRGMIEEIQVYCIRTAAGDIQLRYSPHPCLGPVATVTITPGATWAWVAVDIEQMWNYDSLFLWFHDVDADVSWGYDTARPYDGHMSPCCAIEDKVACQIAGCHWDGTVCRPGGTWAAIAIRPFIRVVMTGETPGDVPVSGIVNTIPIPSASSVFAPAGYALPEDFERTVASLDGAGYCDFIEVIMAPAVGSHTTSIFVICDGEDAMFERYVYMFNRGYNASTPGAALTWYAENGDCVMVISKRFEFRRNIHINAYNVDGDQTVYVRMHPTLMR